MLRALICPSYKRHNIGIPPSGCIIFMSDASAVRIRNEKFTKHGGFLDKLEQNGFVLTDSGYLISFARCQFGNSKIHQRKKR